jgi:DNA-directed RNA polymerase subunit H (RpoH/RPB5)
LIAEKHLKGYLLLAAVIGSLYAGWQVFETYNADQLELKVLEKDVVEGRAAAKAGDLLIIQRLESSTQGTANYYNRQIRLLEAGKPADVTMVEAENRLSELDYNKQANTDTKRALAGDAPLVHE